MFQEDQSWKVDPVAKLLMMKREAQVKVTQPVPQFKARVLSPVD